MEFDSAEHLALLKMKDGTEIEFCRTENKEFQVWHGGHLVRLPKATGQQTLDLFALLESFGELEVEDETT